jgi:hypothetical protein
VTTAQVVVAVLVVLVDILLGQTEEQEVVTG